MSETTPFEMLLRAAGDRAGVSRLMTALGFRRPDADGGAEPGTGCEGTPAQSRATAADAEAPAVPYEAPLLIGTAGGLHALLVELGQPATVQRVARLARAMQQRDPLRPHLLVAADPAYARLTLAASGLDGAVRQLTLERSRPRRSDVEVLEELASPEGEVGTALALRHARTLERSRVTRRFFRDFRGRRDAIAAAWLNLPGELAEHRDALALLFLSRLLFLFFLQREGLLAGDPAYLSALVRAPAAGDGTVYRERMQPLFFGALNRRPQQRDAAALALGPLPYLNGGLFDRHALERKAPELDLPDDILLSAFDLLLDRYRFTSRERDLEGGDAGIDPEMLGRVFEELMVPAQRGATGSYYTPARTVHRLAAEAVATYAALPGVSPRQARELAAGVRPMGLDPALAGRLAKRLAGARVLDPACGSGAFLVGALERLGRARLALAGGDAREVRRDIVARTLYGLDLQADAALLCALRLWLALARSAEDAPPGDLPPLPNLDLRIRQGDALLDPMDLLSGAGAATGTMDSRVRRALARLRPLAQRYLTAEPGEREAVLAELRAGEARLADAWLQGAAGRLEHRRRELWAAALEVDLFGQRSAAASDAERQRPGVEASLAEAQRLRQAVAEQRALPFFSFAVHFADAQRGFDMVLSNPPWVRARRWPAAMRRLVRSRFEVCRVAGWRRGADLAGAPPAAATQVDLALLFLERAITLLAPDGVLAMVLPAKMIRSLYGAGGRRLLLQRTRLVSLHDFSLDQHALFRADAYAATVVAERRPDAAGEAGPERPVHITLARRRVPPLRFSLESSDLPLVPGDADAPWLLAPPGARVALRRMQRCPSLGEHAGLHVRRGVFTGANDVLLVERADVKLSGLAAMAAAGARVRSPAGSTRRGPTDTYQAIVEAAAIAPAVRGAGIRAWRYDTDLQVVWLHDDSGKPVPAPRRMAEYLERHRGTLERRDGARERAGPGALLRVTADTLRPKVAWKDLAVNLEAVALPARVVGPGGSSRPLVPLNTVYFIPVAAAPEALLLAAYLNSLPVRTFARAIAERAKDARFRFFAWVIALLPLPVDWSTGATARRLLALSKDAHAQGGMAPPEQQELDALVAARYGLSAEHVSELAAFDRWLRGEP